MYQLAKSSTATADAVSVIAATPGGNWLLQSNPYIMLTTANKFDVSQLPSESANLYSFDTTVPVASLASAGSVTLITAANALAQYRIRSLELESGGTNFSGGGGDRLGQVTDGTTAYTVIPAAVMQSLVNARWGVSTPLPNAASAANNTLTVAGANLVFKYSGGATDYTAGSLRISGLVQRVV